MKNLNKIFLVIVINAIGLLLGNGPAACAVNLLKGQTLYVPCHTTVIGANNESVNMKANLFIHNTDPQNPISLLRVDLYDENGKLVEKYLAQPLKIEPLASSRFILKQRFKGDTGAAANFVVQWRADNKVVEPLIESVFLGAIGTHGYSFTSQGRIMAEETE